MNAKTTLKSLFPCLIGLLAGPAWGGTSVGTVFTFQGQLKQAGNPLTGDADLTFRLCDDDGGLCAPGTLIVVNNVDVVNGLFTVELDFGPDAFGPAARWLEVSARSPAGGGAFTTLSPRQRITGAPYALYASTGGSGSSLNEAYNKGGPGAGRSINAANGPVNIFGVTDAEPAGGGLLVVGFENGGNVAIDGNEIMARDNGVVSPLFLNDDGGDVLILRNAPGNVAIGTTAPEARLHVNSASDSEPGGGGIVIVGGVAGANLSIDANEIMARNNGAVSTLFLNADGGDIRIGTQTRFFSITGNSFTPDTNLVAFNKNVAYLYGTTDGAAVSFYAAVHLPHGATIGGLSAQVYDFAAQAASNVSIDLRRVSETGASQSISSAESAGFVDDVRTILGTRPENAMVDNDTYSYFVYANWTVPSGATPVTNVRLYRVRISYTVNEPLP